MMTLFNEKGRDNSVDFRHKVGYDHRVLLLGSNNDKFGRLSSKLKFGTVSLSVAYMGFHSP